MKTEKEIVYSVDRWQTTVDVEGENGECWVSEALFKSKESAIKWLSDYLEKIKKEVSGEQPEHSTENIKFFEENELITFDKKRGYLHIDWDSGGSEILEINEKEVD